jgi:peptidoglycan/LPS O-acetylase OafA/YrhL
VGLALLFVAGEVYNVVVLSQVDDGSYSHWLRWAFSYLDHFVAGMALAVATVALQRRKRSPAPVRLIERMPSVAWAVALAAFVFVSLGIGLGDDEPPTDAQSLARRTLYVVIAVGVVLPAVFGEPGQGLTRRLLGWRPLLWVGLVSYGAFLYNIAVLTQLDRWGVSPLGDGIHPYLKVVDVLVPTLAVAALSYYLVERPALSLKRLVGPRAKPAPPIVPAAPGSRQSA